MTGPTLSHIRRLMNNPWKLVHPLSRVGASLLCGNRPLDPQVQLLSLGLCLCHAWKATGGYETSGRRVSALMINKKTSPDFEHRMNKCSWPRDLWLWRSQGWNTSNNDTINWCCRTQAPQLHLRVEKCKQNRAATSLLPFCSTHNWFQVTLKKVVESKDLRGSPRDTYSICQ